MKTIFFIFVAMSTMLASIAFAQSACETETEKAKAISDRCAKITSSNDYAKCQQEYQTQQAKATSDYTKCRQESQTQLKAMSDYKKCLEDSDNAKCQQETQQQQAKALNDYTKCTSELGTKCQQEQQQQKKATNDYAECLAVNGYHKCDLYNGSKCIEEASNKCQQQNIQQAKTQSDLTKCFETSGFNRGFTKCQQESQTQQAKANKICSDVNTTDNIYNAADPPTLVGKWIEIYGYENDFIMEFSSNGTGVATSTMGDIESSISAITWKTENDILYFDQVKFGVSSKVKYKLQGSTLTIIYNSGDIVKYTKCNKDCNESAKKYVKEHIKEYAKAVASKIKKNSFIDSRDNKTYKTVVIGTQTWMAENLNYNAENSKCYNNSESNCQKYGRLYNWKTAMKACPSGWHLPSYDEWETLVDLLLLDIGKIIGASIDLGKKNNDGHFRNRLTIDRWNGNVLKASSGWEKNGNGEDVLGFAALPGGLGYSDGNFYNVGNGGYWWSSTDESNNTSSYAYNLSDVNDYGLNADYYDEDNNKYQLLSVRCIQGELSKPTDKTKPIDNRSSATSKEQCDKEIKKAKIIFDKCKNIGKGNARYEKCAQDYKTQAAKAKEVCRGETTQTSTSKQEERNQKYDENLVKQTEFLEKNKNKVGVVTTGSGLQYIILKEGEGETAKDGNIITAHYTTTFLDGKKIDSSLDRNQPLSIALGEGQLIKGWVEILRLMKKGEKVKVWIPSSLGYGEYGNNAIPGNSLLIFEIELLDIRKAK
ncbi:hypothetical protein R83H12_00272 [Fibrobacteria bacterium R8-3-H12]